MRLNYNYNKIRFAKNNNMNINNKEPSEFDLKQIIDGPKNKNKRNRKWIKKQAEENQKLINKIKEYENISQKLKEENESLRADLKKMKKKKLSKMSR